MINKIINNIINSSTNTLFESKDKIINIARKRAEEEINPNIPSPATFEAKLKSIQINNNTQNDLLKVERFYNVTIDTLDKAIKRFKDSQKELKLVKSKLTKITNQMTTLEVFPDILNPIFDMLKGLFPTIDGFLSASSSTLANGLLINKLGESKKDLKDLLKKGEDNLTSIDSISDFFRKEKAKIEEPIDRGISSLGNIIGKLENIKSQIIGIYQEFTLSLNIPELNDEDNDNELLGNENLSDYIKDENNLSSLFSDAIGKGEGNDPDSSENNTDFGGNTSTPIKKSLVFKKLNQ
tara:strand:+ start:32 stop:916 length:885 start_codon:yes stop_codon:yes gene_type:complete